jgi:hypothetical protein
MTSRTCSSTGSPSGSDPVSGASRSWPRAAERWRSIRITEFERRQMDALRQELDHAAVGLDTGRSRQTPAAKFPGDLTVTDSHHGMQLGTKSLRNG